MSEYAVVIPTVGRPSLAPLLVQLSSMVGPPPEEVVVVHDRPGVRLDVVLPAGLPARVMAGPGRGPAAARNVGWRSTGAPWVVFVDDDVQLGPQWMDELAQDLRAAEEIGADGSQARLVVPLPADRRPTDWERQVAGLATASWVTADMAYRRDALEDVGGFDERFPRAYREDADLALRLRQRHHPLLHGTRSAVHPVRPAPPWVSLARQAGNADDALMRRLHGPHWRELAEAPAGRRPRHAAVTVAGAIALLAAATGRRRLAGAAGLAWAAGTAEFALHRIGAGPRTQREVATMAVTSALIPPLAVGHWLRGWYHHRGAR